MLPKSKHNLQVLGDKIYFQYITVSNNPVTIFSLYRNQQLKWSKSSNKALFCSRDLLVPLYTVQLTWLWTECFRDKHPEGNIWHRHWWWVQFLNYFREFTACSVFYDPHVLSVLSRRTWSSYGQIQPSAQEEGEWEGRVSGKCRLSTTGGDFSHQVLSCKHPFSAKGAALMQRECFPSI